MVAVLATEHDMCADPPPPRPCVDSLRSARDYACRQHASRRICRAREAELVHPPEDYTTNLARVTDATLYVYSAVSLLWTEYRLAVYDLAKRKLVVDLLVAPEDMPARPVGPVGRTTAAAPKSGPLVLLNGIRIAPGVSDEHEHGSVPLPARRRTWHRKNAARGADRGPSRFGG